MIKVWRIRNLHPTMQKKVLVMKCPKYHSEFWLVGFCMAWPYIFKGNDTMLHDVHNIYPYPCPHSGSTSCSSDWSRKSAWETHSESRSMLHRIMAWGRGKNHGVILTVPCVERSLGGRKCKKLVCWCHNGDGRKPTSQLIWKNKTYVNIPSFTGFHNYMLGGAGFLLILTVCQIPSCHKCSKTKRWHVANVTGKHVICTEPERLANHDSNLSDAMMQLIYDTWNTTFATCSSSMDLSISFSGCNFRRFYSFMYNMTTWYNMMGQTNRWFCFIPRNWKLSKAVFVSDNKRILSVSCPPWIQAEAESFERFLYTCPVCTGKDCNTNMYKYSSNTYPYTRRYTHTHTPFHCIALHCIALHCLHHITLHTYIHEEYSQQECRYRSTCSFHWKSLNYIK